MNAFSRLCLLAADSRWRIAIASVLLTASTGFSATLTYTTDLELWLRADAGVTTVSGDVLHWADQSGNANHAEQSNAGLRPTLVSGAINGEPAVRFNGSGDALPLDVLNGGVDQSLITTVFVVFNSDATGSGAQNILARPTAGPPYAPAVYHGMFFAQQPSVYWGFGPAIAYPTPVLGWNTVRYEWDATDIEIAVNGGAPVTTTHSNTHVSKWTSLSLAGFGQDFKGDIAEVLIYNAALDEAQNAQVQAYLNAKYVPEPATAALLAPIAGAWALRRRRR
jgi:hypothetical protein